MELAGTKDGFGKLTSVKDRLSINRASIDGVWYDASGTNKKKFAEITLPLHMHPSTIIHFWNNRNGLLNTLASLNADGHAIRQISDDTTSLKCYYKKCAINKFKVLSNSSVWCDFTLTFAVIERSAVS